MSEREATQARSPFARIAWEGKQPRIGNVKFVIEEYGVPSLDPPVGGELCFLLYKPKGLLDVYEAFFSSVPGYRPSRIFEIGIWKAGSVVFFTELFDVEKLVAIDLAPQSRLAPSILTQLNAWLDRDDHRSGAKLYFEVDQGDERRLRDIVRTEFPEALDLVIDDGSHLYGPTKRSFEVLFPYLGPGGWYVIEDWSWSLHPAFQQAGHPWALKVPMARLIGEVLTLAGARPEVIPEIRVSGALAFIQRGPAQLDDSFSIEQSTPRRPYGRVGVLARRAWWAASRFGDNVTSRRRSR